MYSIEFYCDKYTCTLNTHRLLSQVLVFPVETVIWTTEQLNM